SLHGNAAFLSVVMALIVLGGLGFPVLRNIAQVLVTRRRGGSHKRLTLYSRIVLVATLALIVAGTACFALLERSGVLGGESAAGRLLHSLFQSVTARTAGFNTVPIGSLRAPTLILLIVLMWIGASPGSTGGGIRTTTFVLLVLDTFSVIRGKDRVRCGRANVDPASVSRAHATALVSVLCVAAGFLVLTMSESQPFVGLLFESFSAAGTVGLSTGVTPALTTTGKAVVCALMFIGRVGFLTVAMMLTPRGRARRVDYATQSIPTL
ncbi:MAG TPA: potassium transporter TrkG, partial [Spirochaetia bacterium]